MKRLRGVSVALIIAALPVAASAASFGKIYAFGDSLNDCCVLGPFTNGPQTWIPALAGAIGADYPSPENATQNYAVGGAQSGASNVIPSTDAGLGYASGLLSQIDRFEADVASVSADDLAVVWVGTNDIWSAAFTTPSLFGAIPIFQPLGSRPSVDALAEHVAGNIAQGAARLRDKGFGKLLIVTPFDVGQSALTEGAETSALQTEYSQAVRDRLVGLHIPGIDTWTLDMLSLIAGLQAGAPGNGFSFLTGADSCAPFGSAPGTCEARPAAEQDAFLFYDAVHLTTATNAVVSAEAAALLTLTAPIAPVPLPASAALLLAGFGALCAAGRRARAPKAAPALA